MSQNQIIIKQTTHDCCYISTTVIAFVQQNSPQNPTQITRNRPKFSWLKQSPCKDDRIKEKIKRPMYAGYVHIVQRPCLEAGKGARNWEETD